MKIIFWGTPEYSLESLKSLLNSKHEILAVITQPDKKRSRGKNLIPSPIKELAIINNIPVKCPIKIKDNLELVSTLKSLKPDIFIVIAYGKILTKEILEIPKYGCWNAHASLLPRWRGAAPIQWALISGDKYTGVGIMKMDEGLDTGDILIEEKVKIEITENLQTLKKKLSNLSAKLILQALEIIYKDFENIHKLLSMQEIKSNKIKYARMIEKKDYLLNFDDSSNNILKKINGLYPKAYIIYKNKNLKIISARELNSSEIRELSSNKQFIEMGIGNMILSIKDNKGIIISTKTKPLIILEIKLEGKNISNKNQLIQQLKPIVGEKFHLIN
tara:strand:+ start:4501 stop:5493 length:993 start_codon:yes stop_codon:yes gene_type:complete